MAFAVSVLYVATIIAGSGCCTLPVFVASFFFFFFFNDTATPEIYPLSLPDPLPICRPQDGRVGSIANEIARRLRKQMTPQEVKRSEEHTSELQSRGLISYAVFC